MNTASLGLGLVGAGFAATSHCFLCRVGRNESGWHQDNVSISSLAVTGVLNSILGELLVVLLAFHLSHSCLHMGLGPRLTGAGQREASGSQRREGDAAPLVEVSSFT